MVLLHGNHTLRLPMTVCPLLFLPLHHVSCDVKQCLSEHLQRSLFLLGSCFLSMPYPHAAVSVILLSCLLRTSSLVLLLQCALPHCSRLGCDPRTWVFMNESLCQVCDSFKAYWNSTFNTELGSDLDVSTKLTTKRYPEFLKTSLVI